jgi:hypothetical protein
MAKQPKAKTIARQNTADPILPRGRKRAGFITIARARKLLHCSAWKVRALVQSGELAADELEGVLYFRENDVARLALARGVEQTGTTNPSGKVAALAFKMLSRGQSPLDLVTDLQLTPEVAKRFVADFNELRSIEIARSPKTSQCAGCGDAAARYCGGCAVRPGPVSAQPAAAPAPASAARAAE